MRALVGSVLVMTACGPGGRLTGTVVVAGGQPSLATVVATGPSNGAASVDPDGTYALDGLSDGRYLVAASSPWTLETEASAGAAVAGGSGQVAALHLTGAGYVSGRVTAPVDVTGARVVAAGGGAGQTVGVDGAFHFLCAAGRQTLVPSLPGWAPASQSLTVLFATDNDGVELALAAPAAGAGEISGHAFYFDKPNASGITVAVAGTGLATQTAADGSFLLAGVPQGSVTLLYSAPGYASATRAGVVAGIGAPVVVPDVRLELAQSAFSGRVFADLLYPAPDGSGALFVGTPESAAAASWIYYLPLATPGAAVPIQPVPQPVPLNVAWRADGLHAAVAPGPTDSPQALYDVDVDAGTAFQVTGARYPGPTSGLVWAPNGSLMYLERAADGNPLFAVFQPRTATTQRFDEVSLPAQAFACGGPAWAPGAWPNGDQLFQWSDGGSAAYLAAGDGGASGAVRLVTGGAAQTVGAGAACLGFRGETLLGVTVGETLSVQSFATGAPVTLLSAPADAFWGGFTGDGAYAWLVSDSVEEYALQLAPVMGGPLAWLDYSGVPFDVWPQPFGNQLAIDNTHGNQSVVVESPAGAMVHTYAPVSTQGASNDAFYSPLGKWFVVAYAPDQTLLLADAATQTPRVLSGQPWTVSAALSSTFLFSPTESAVAYASLWAGACQNQLLIPGGPVLASGTLGCPLVSEWVSFDPTGRFALVHGGTDSVVDLSFGTTVELGRATYPLDGSLRYFTGDGRRLVFRDASAPPVHVVSVDPETGATRLAADAAGAYVYAVPGNATLVLVADPALLPPGSTPVRPQGIYVLTAP